MALFYLQFLAPSIPIVVINLKFERVFGQDGTRLRLDTFFRTFLPSKNEKKKKKDNRIILLEFQVWDDKEYLPYFLKLYPFLD